MDHKKWERVDAIDGVGTFVEDSYTKGKEKTCTKMGNGSGSDFGQGDVRKESSRRLCNTFTPLSPNRVKKLLL